jgi:hypothetical protein
MAVRVDAAPAFTDGGTRKMGLPFANGGMSGSRWTLTPKQARRGYQVFRVDDHRVVRRILRSLVVDTAAGGDSRHDSDVWDGALA